MKKFLLSFMLTAMISLSSFSQTTIIGDNQCISPYCGCDPVTVQRSGVPPGEWVELILPTNIVTTVDTNNKPVTTITTQSWGWMQAGASGVVTFVFNASLTDAVVSTTIANGWVLSAGPYVAITKYFSDKSGGCSSCQSTPLIIGGSNSTAIATAVKNKKKVLTK